MYEQAATSMIEHNLSHQLCSRPDISTDTDCAIIAVTGVATLSCSALMSVLLNAVTCRACVFSCVHEQIKLVKGKLVKENVTRGFVQGRVISCRDACTPCSYFFRMFDVAISSAQFCRHFWRTEK